MTRPWRLRRRLVVAATAAIVGALAGVAPVIAQPRDNASRSDVLRIAIVFVAGAPQDGELAREVARVITANLERSGRFTPIDPAAFTEKITGFDAVPRFDDLRAADVQCLVTGRITHQPDDRLRAEFRLWDVTGGVQLMGQQYFTSTDHPRLIGHIMSDAIYERLTGRKGNFESGSR